MINPRGYKISVRGFNALDEDVPEGAVALVEGEDLATAPILALDEDGQIVANYADAPDEVAEKFRAAAVAMIDALEAEIEFGIDKAFKEAAAEREAATA